MGIEYQANLEGSTTTNLSSELIGLFASHRDYVVVWVEDNRIALRFATTKLRPDWPEDIQINADKTRIYVLFHWASKVQRERLLSLICDTLEAKNVKCEVEDF